MLDTTQFDVSNFYDKHFHTYRKTKVFNETINLRYHGINWINKTFTRNTEDVYDLLMENDFAENIGH